MIKGFFRFIRMHLSPHTNQGSQGHADTVKPNLLAVLLSSMDKREKKEGVWRLSSFYGLAYCVVAMTMSRMLTLPSRLRSAMTQSGTLCMMTLELK